MTEEEAIGIMQGIILLIILVKLLKYILKQKRPNGGMYGMPSTRAAILSFTATYMLLMTKLTKSGINIIISLALFGMYLKYATREHSLLQLLAGSILGILYASFIHNKKIVPKSLSS